MLPVRSHSSKVEHCLYRLALDICTDIPRVGVFGSLREHSCIEDRIALLFPAIRHFLLGVDPCLACLTHVCDGLANPIHCVVDDDGEIGKWRLRPAHHEEIWEASYGDAICRCHLLSELLAQVLVFRIADVYLAESAGHSVKADLLLRQQT